MDIADENPYADDSGLLISGSSPIAEDNHDSGIDPDPDNPDFKFSDKASFREKSTSFLRVLEDSTKYRKLPEPKGKKPGRLEEIDSPRGVREMEDEDALITPRRAHENLRPLARAKAGQTTKDETPIPTSHKSRYSRYDDLPVTPRPRQPRSTATVSLPPVPGVSPGLMGSKLGGGQQDRAAVALSYSRQGNDILAKIRTTQTPENSPSSPAQGRKRDRDPGSRISLDTQGLLSPRENNK